MQLAEPTVVQFQSQLGLQALPYLADHRLQGEPVMPATVFLEMARAGAADVFGGGPVELTDVSFEKLLFLPSAGHRTVRLVLVPEGERALSFEIQALAAESADPAVESSWLRHAAGRAWRRAEGQEEPPRGSDVLPEASDRDSARTTLETIRERCTMEIDPARYYANIGKFGLDYGPTFQGIRRLWRRDGEALGELELPTALDPDLYEFHPALLDAGLQVMAVALPASWAALGDTGMYVPTGVACLRVHQRCGGRAWSRAVLPANAVPTASALDGDIFLYDDAGDLLVEVRGLRVQRLGRDAARKRDVRDWLFTLEWQPRPLPDGAADASLAGRPGTWLIFTDRGGAGQSLRALLEAQGQTCVLVEPGPAFTDDGPGRFGIDPQRVEDMERLVQQVLGGDGPPCRGVLHLWSLDVPAPEQTGPAALAEATRLGCGSVLHLVQQLARRATPEPPALWLLTRGAQFVGAGQATCAIAQAPLWGLGKVIALEHAGLRCSRLDLDPAGDADEAARIVRELAASDGEDQIAFRGGVRHVQRLKGARLG